GQTHVTMPFQTWTHIAITADNNLNAWLYINGTARDSISESFFFNDGDPFRIGSQTTGFDGLLSQFFIGTIDEVKVWQSTRTSSQVKTDMFTIPDVTDPNLTVYYDMNETSGTVVSNSAITTSMTQTGMISRDSAYVWVSSPM